MKVVFTLRARDSLREIGRYIAKHNPERARTFVAMLRNSAREIGRQPLIYPVVIGSTIRRRVVGEYLILYLFDIHTVTIVDVRHGARDLIPVNDPNRS